MGASWSQDGRSCDQDRDLGVILGAILEDVFVVKPDLVEMGEVEKRTTVQRFWWIFRIWSVAWRLLEVILSGIRGNLRSYSGSWGYD